MELRETELDGVVELRPTRHGDERGWFSEVWNEATLAELGINIAWVQDNEARSATAGTLRGLHFQVEPHAQDKLVRAVQGRIVDVAVDLRQSSATFGQHVCVELTEQLGNQLLVPQGFAHGYCTLEPNTVIGYKVSGFYSPTCDRSLRWDDPELGIDWPVHKADAVLSNKDQVAPHLSEIESSFFE
jgi:dTDP-4-dehydrorhamnose 3,5-epimerase